LELWIALGAGALTGTDLELQERILGLVRALGLHKPDERPCGQPVAVAGAHALMELLGGVVAVAVVLDEFPGRGDAPLV
jgi:hypothetical protein